MSTKVLGPIRVIDAAPGTTRLLGQEFRVVRGALEPDQLSALSIPRYQRIAMVYGDKHHELVEAMGPEGKGSPSDLILCARSDEYTYVGDFVVMLGGQKLHVLDGHQRYFALRRRLKDGLPVPKVGVKIILGTKELQERELFWLHNRPQTRVSSQKHADNLGTNTATQALREMAEASPLVPAVQWDQSSKGTVITAQTLFEVALLLHGWPQRDKIEYIIEDLQELTNGIGVDNLISNTLQFFEILHECFPDGTSTMSQYRYKRNVMCGLAMLFGRHQEFWHSRRPALIVRGPVKGRIASIQKEAEKVPAMLKSRSGAGEVRDWFAGFINKKRRTKKLQPRELRG